MDVPIPAEFNAEEAKEYVKKVNEEPELRRLLEKALYFHEKNVTVARDAGVSTGWSEESAKQADAIRELMARQVQGNLVVPGTVKAASGPAPQPAGTESAGGRPVRDVY